MTVTLDDGTTQDLDFRCVADRHVRSGWVRTIHSAQGATAERVMAHVESFRANTVDARSAYVAISRTRSGAALYTDSRARLTEALGLRDGAQVGAIDQIRAHQSKWGGDRAMTRDGPAGQQRSTDRLSSLSWERA
jgi:ATP-dependent exoDNAse (exonuclease V) alpha subunit